MFAVGALCATILCSLDLGSNQISAQELQQYKRYDRYRYMPKFPRGNENPQSLPSNIKENTGNKDVIVKKLKAIVLVDNPADVVTGPIKKSGIVVDPGSLFILQSPEFESIASEYLGKPVSLYSVNQIVRDIIVFYRQNDRPVVDVSVPVQDITDGVIQIVVTEATIGQVRVEGAQFFDNQMLRNQLHLYEGDNIYESVLQEELRWLYRNPYRTANLELKPGEQRGTTDIVFKISDKRPGRIYYGYEDTGIRNTGLERTLYGVNWFNMFQRDDYFGYQYTASSDFNSLGAHSAFYSTALANRDILSIYGAYSDYTVMNNPFTRNRGYGWQLLGRWNRDLQPIGNYEHDVQAGFDYKRSNANFLFGNVVLLGTEISVVQMMAGYTGRYEDETGSWSAGCDLYYSPGHWGGHNKDTDFLAFRPFASAAYGYARGFAERRRNVTADGGEFVARFTGQLAEGNLPFSEQLGFGGYNSIRGYDMYSVLGDSGYFVNLEYITAPTTLLYEDDELRFLGFYDFGDSYNHTLLPAEDPSVDLQSVGLGLRYRNGSSVELRADYGWQLSDLLLLPEPNSRWHVGIVCSY